MLCCALAPAGGAELAQTIAAVKPSVVGIGTLLKLRSPAMQFVATGFVTGDGLDIITNAHALLALDSERQEALGVLLPVGENGVQFRPAQIVSVDREHDLAHLLLSGQPLPALKLAEGGELAEGTELALTGYPLAMALGLHAATHRALLAAVTPIVLPSATSGKLSSAAIMQLQRPPFMIYQLDATAFPGNSGSPVYEPHTGLVVGIINMVFVKGLKENAISNPSGIAYAVPVRHVRELMQRKGPAQK
ncbi:MAG: serine protease [Pseudomonadota bacterium]